jgi:TonB family protein
MIWIAIAAQLAAPEPKAMWFFVGDNPAPKKEMLVSFRATVDTNGNVQDCEIERSNGTPKIDALTCQVTMKRARFHPARWTDGTASYGVYRTHVLWLPTGATQSRLKAASNLVLTVSRLPDGMTSPAGVGLLLAVDEHGGLSACEGVDGSQNSMLVKVACGQAAVTYHPVSVRNGEGASVKSVQPVAVEFVKE